MWGDAAERKESFAGAGKGSGRAGGAACASSVAAVWLAALPLLLSKD